MMIITLNNTKASLKYDIYVNCPWYLLLLFAIKIIDFHSFESHALAPDWQVLDYGVVSFRARIGISFFATRSADWLCYLFFKKRV